jgi:hypothetical protein
MVSVPFGLSVTGCAKKSAPVEYCNSGDSGPVVGQVASITLASNLATTGESLNYGQYGQSLSASAIDCKNNNVSVSHYTFASTSSYSNSASGTVFADINPSTGQVCAGTWNRNTGGGVADYTTCTAPTATPVSSTAPLTLTPTAATASKGSTIAVQLAQATDVIGGTLTLSVGSARAHAISVANIPLSSLATQINSDATFAAEGISAAYNLNTTVLTITGPVGASNTISTAGALATSTLPAVPATAVTDDTVAFLAYVTATANGAVSNAIPVYVHPTVTGVVLGGSTPGALNGSCPAGTLDPGTDCCPNSTVGTAVTAPVYTGTGCISQNKTGQLISRVYTGGNTLPANNITCQVGHLSYGVQNASNVVAIDTNGVATAQQPGSTAITATIAQSSTATNAGFFSTCPPASIALTVNGSTTNATVPINNSVPLTATVLDTNNNPITGLSLEYNSTEPQTIPGGGGTITPIYPSTANLSAVCQPSTCNPSGFSQIGVFGNGKPVTSNTVSVTATGQSSTVIYAGSLQTATNPGSQYVYTVDFTTNQPGTLIKLPYVPNSMVMTLSGQSIYLGSSGGLMTLTTANNTVSAANQSIAGTVLAVSPDASTIVVTDPVRQTISLYGGSGNLISAYGGVGTRAVWSPDDQTVYVTTNTGTILEHGTFTDWQVASPTQVYNDVAVTVPSVGAYFAGPAAADGRSYCSSTTNIVLGNPPTASNAFLPLADSDTAAIMDRIAATNDGLHILGAHVASSGAPTFTDLNVTLPVGACPTVIPTNYFKSAAFVKPLTTTGSTPVTVGATSITGIVPSNNEALAFVTYTGTSGLLPYYFVQGQGSFGTLGYVTLSSGTAPLSGVFSTDNSTFYVGTSGDNLIHEITVTYPASGAPTAVDSGTLTPQLPAASGTGFAPVNVVTQHPKKAQA